MNHNDWIIILLSINLLFGAFYLGIKYGRYRLTKEFMNTIINGDPELEEIAPQDNPEDADWLEIGGETDAKVNDGFN